MRLLTQFMGRTLLALLIVMPIWGVLYYWAMLGEVYDEIDDQLEEYGVRLISDIRQTDSLPTYQAGSNNIYYVSPISHQDLRKMKLPSFSVKEVYFPTKAEYEPARVYRTSFIAKDGKPYILTIYTPSLETNDLMESIFIWILVLFLSLTIVLCIINWMIYKHSMQPLFKLLDWFKQYKLGEKGETLNNPTRIREFQQLNEAVMLSVDRSEQVYEQQKQFIGNASHEIQTPIAVAQNRIELLLDTDLTEEQMGELLKVNQSLTYISKLNRSLLLLSKLDNGQVNESEPVNVSLMIEHMVADFELAYSGKHATIEQHIEPNIVLVMDAALAQTLFSNLIKNAFVHSKVSGTIKILLTSSIFAIENGVYDKALDGAHLFDRFYQVYRQEGTSGLGLAIAKAICGIYRYKLTYNYNSGYHRFEVSFFQ